MPATIADIRWARKNGASRPYRLGPLVKLDQERCILCTRCVRFTRNVTKTNEIQVFSRGHHSEIGNLRGKAAQQCLLRQCCRCVPGWRADQCRFSFQSSCRGSSREPIPICGGCSTGCNIRIDHSARAAGRRHTRLHALRTARFIEQWAGATSKSIKAGCAMKAG